MLNETASISSVPDLFPTISPPERHRDHCDDPALYVMPTPRNGKIRHWDTVTVYNFVRPAGESIVRVPYMRLLIDHTPLPAKVTIRVDSGRPHQFVGQGTSITLVPRDATAQVITEERQLTHIFHDPAVYRQAAEEIGNGVGSDLDFVFNLRYPRIAELAGMLAREVDGPGFGERMLVEGLSYALAVHVLRFLSGLTPPQIGGLSPERLQRVTDFIEAHIADSNLSLHEMAAIVCLSTYQFGRAFKHSTGVTPHQFVLARRIERAKSMLREGNLSLSAIAGATGFADQAHFNHRFRQVTLTTPRQYRLATTG
ncbi:MAG TPA: AraC family transcriptional regulator [Xanthobacteraceae bacterium]|jgi:AraC-like DNA-binding protein